MEKSLSLSEKIYLLAIHPEKGGISSSSYSALSYVLIGALFLELFLEDKIEFENKRIIVKNSKTNNPLHRLILEKMVKSKRPLKVTRWVNKFNFMQKKIRKQIRNNLSGKRLIKVEDKKFLFFRWKKPALINKPKVYQMQSEIESHIFKGTADKETILLLSLLKPARLMKRIFPEKQKRKTAERKLKLMMVDNQVSAAVADAIAAAQAVAASVAVSAATSSAATSG